MSSPVAVVTGTTSGIGEAIARMLLTQGWSVCGLARRPATIADVRYQHHVVDLTDLAAVSSCIEMIEGQSPEIGLLVNNAGIGYFAPHEELSLRQIQEMVALNLTAPLILTRGFLRALKRTQGWIINIASFSAHESSSFGAAYAATKAGVQHFGDSLFDEVRKSGVRVATISPDITRTPFFDNLNFSPEDDPVAAITPECIAESVQSILAQRPGTVVTNIVIRPQRLLLKKGRR